VKIGIDTFGCESGSSAVGVYLAQILRRVPPSGERVELFGWDYDRFAFGETAPDLEFISRCRFNGAAANTLWHFLRYPDLARGRGWDACFFPAAHRRLCWNSPCLTVGVVHDMAAWWGPRMTRQQLGGARRLALPALLRRLDRVIAVSGWVRDGLVNLAGVKPERIEVVPNGIDLAAFHPRPRNDDSVVLIQPFSFRRPYVLYASRLEYPAKNHVRLIEAFSIFKARTGFPHRLVLAGADSHGAARIKAAAARSPCRNDIFFTGHFPYGSLPELYAGADLVVIPSLYEGFGMGALEAMACGVPVVCARAGSLPEAADRAALYFDPLSPEDMADRMVSVTTNRDLNRDCRRRGLERVKEFSWEACAERTLGIIRETAGG